MLGDLVRELGGTCALADTGPEIRGVELDSRRVREGDLFVALSGTVRDGRAFAADAVTRGASAVLSAEPIEGLDAPLWIHPGARAVAGRAAALVAGHPARGMHVIAVTGTNGKTTTAHLIGQLLEACEFRPAILGTAGYRLADGEWREASHTTPDAPTLQALLREHRSLGGDSVVLEASSHALVQERLAGLDVTCAVYTNLSRDHLDYHGDMEQYAQAKARLFRGLDERAVAILNADDDYTAVMQRAAEEAGSRVLTYSSQSQADLRASLLCSDLDTTYLTLSGMGISLNRLRLDLLGRFNVENALAAVAAVLMSGASPSAIVEGLAAVSPPPGRLERVSTGSRDLHVFVDYAHTEDALRRSLGVLRDSMTDDHGELVVVFGCGGDRDRGKRAPMGRAATELADRAILTSDNPRGEDPLRILEEVRAGATGGAEVHVEPDRRAAIAHALRGASPGDVVLIAGKGHETVQIAGGEVHRFDDRVVAREVLA